MKFNSPRGFIALVLATFLLCIGGGAASAAEPDASKLPAEKQDEWSRIKSAQIKERNVCSEHCGAEKSCLNRCQTAYENRLNTAYQRLLHSDSAPQQDIETVPSCPYCGMDRKKFSHSRIYVEYDDGSVLGTCSLHCAGVDMAVNIDKAPAKIWVGDYGTKALIDAERAVWVIGGDKPGVMTKRAKWAFGTKASAEAYIQANGGKIAEFEAAMAATFEDMYADTKMIRDRRAKKRMMHMKK